MPIYSYKCSSCFRERDIVQSMGADAPVCCGKSMEKQLTYPVMVKIRGWGLWPSQRKLAKGTAAYSGRR